MVIQFVKLCFAGQSRTLQGFVVTGIEKPFAAFPGQGTKLDIHQGIAHLLSGFGMEDHHLAPIRSPFADLKSTMRSVLRKLNSCQGRGPVLGELIGVQKDLGKPWLGVGFPVQNGLVLQSIVFVEIRVFPFLKRR